jgi:hypothetical protein
MDNNLGGELSGLREDIQAFKNVLSRRQQSLEDMLPADADAFRRDAERVCRIHCCPSVIAC